MGLETYLYQVGAQPLLTRLRKSVQTSSLYVPWCVNQNVVFSRRARAAPLTIVVCLEASARLHHCCSVRIFRLELSIISLWPLAACVISRILVCAREFSLCAPASSTSSAAVPDVVETAATMMGVRVKKCRTGGGPSRQTVCRAILEGGIAVDVQLGYEIKKAPHKFHSGCCALRALICLHFLALTYSGDGTTHQNETIEARHLAYWCPELYTSNPLENQRGEHVVRLLGVSAAVNHTADTQLAGFRDRIDQISATFLASPLAHRDGVTMGLHNVALKAKSEKELCRHERMETRSY